MQIVAALHIEGIDLRQPSPGGPSQIDLTGVHFTLVATAPPPITVTPHLVVIVRCPPDHDGSGVLEVIYRRPGSDEPVARNVQPLQIDPGRFGYRLVRAELEFTDYETLEAHCRLSGGQATIVPLSLVPAPETT
jgi:hypothetical protein